MTWGLLGGPCAIRLPWAYAVVAQRDDRSVATDASLAWSARGRPRNADVNHLALTGVACNHAGYRLPGSPRWLSRPWKERSAVLSGRARRAALAEADAELFAWAAGSGTSCSGRRFSGLCSGVDQGYLAHLDTRGPSLAALHAQFVGAPASGTPETGA